MKKKKLPTLGIVIDTANRERIDGDISVCKKIIKIDHHIVVDLMEISMLKMPLHQVLLRLFLYY